MARSKKIKKRVARRISQLKLRKEVARKAAQSKLRQKALVRAKKVQMGVAGMSTAYRTGSARSGVPMEIAHDRLWDSAKLIFDDRRVRSLGISRYGSQYGFRVVRNSALITPESGFQSKLLDNENAADFLGIPVTYVDTPHEVEHHVRVPYAGPGSPTAASHVLEQGRTRPLCSGLQIQNYDDDLRTGSISKGSIVVGTLGCFVKADDGSSALLSNNHVVAGENRGIKGKDRICQPGAATFGSNDLIGILKEFVDLKASPVGASVSNGNAVFNDVDAGLASIPDGTPFAQGYHPGRAISAPNKSGSPKLGDKVYKVGRTTGLTYGRITDIATIVGPVPYDPGLCWFQGSFTIEGIGGAMFSDKGDSGSAIVGPNGEILGLLYAGNGQQTYACTIDAVFKALKCSLY